MIARMWQGWTSKQNADAYESLLRNKILPGIYEVPGYKGGYVLRRDIADETQFVTITLFTSLDAVRGFAGPDYEKAVISPEAHALLLRGDEKAVHYDIAVAP